MESAAASGVNKNCKVTLTNWKRLSNVPPSVNLDGVMQQGVHWREFLVFLDASKVQLHLYHLKMGIWSSMDSINLCCPARGCPLTVFQGNLIMLSKANDVYNYVTPWRLGAGESQLSSPTN